MFIVPACSLVARNSRRENRAAFLRKVVCKLVITCDRGSRGLLDAGYSILLEPAHPRVVCPFSSRLPQQ